MNTIHKKIKEGITFHYIPCDKFTSSSFSVHFLMPLADDTAALYCLLSRVLKKGSARYPSQEAINKRLEELYAASVGMGVSKLGESESFFVSANMLDNRFAFDGTGIEEETISLAKSLLCAPLLEGNGFCGHIVSREKKALTDRIRAQINNKSAYAMNRCREIMCADEPYRFSVMGTEEAVGKITPASLYRAYLDILSSARMEIIYIGSKSLDAAQALAERFCEDLAPRAYTDKREIVISSPSETRRVTECVCAAQGNLVLGFRTASTAEEDSFALMLFDAVYGSSPVSKLFMNVRERLSLCYHCSSRCDRHKGVMFVTAGIENKNAKVAEDEILNQLEEIRNGNISDKELAYAKEALLDGLRTVTDSQASMESWCLHHAKRGSVLTPTETAEKIEALTREDIVRVAQGITLDTVYFLEGKGTEDV